MNTATDTKQTEELELSEQITRPSKETQEAIDELEAGGCRRFADLDSLFRWLDDEDD